MKKSTILLLAFFLPAVLSSCNKSKSCATSAVIVHNTVGCPSWGINVGINYISDNIPDEFKLEGLQVCVAYELWEDMRLCVCCGGTRARIITMNRLPD